MKLVKIFVRNVFMGNILIKKINNVKYIQMELKDVLIIRL